METNASNPSQRDPKRYCSLPSFPERVLPADMHPLRESFIRVIEKTWLNGTKIHFCFLNPEKGHPVPAAWAGTDGDEQVVRQAFDQWKELGIGLDFVEVDRPQDAEVRIGFLRGDGSWSTVGKDALDVPWDRRTTNFGWSLTQNWYGMETALHEIGHVLGAPHEHQNPKSGIQWNEAAVYAYFEGPPNNWSREKTHYNVLRKLRIDQIDGSEWDPNSIMHYSFDAEMIAGPVPYNEQGIIPTPGLTPRDKEWVKRFYPPISMDDYTELVPFQSHPATLKPGEQINFVIKPDVTRNYTMQTFGQVDTVMVLSEMDEPEPRYLSGDDDSGTDYNAKIEHKLQKGRTYLLRIRLYFAWLGGDTAVMIW